MFRKSPGSHSAPAANAVKGTTLFWNWFGLVIAPALSVPSAFNTTAMVEKAVLTPFHTMEKLPSIWKGVSGTPATAR